VGRAPCKLSLAALLVALPCAVVLLAPLPAAAAPAHRHHSHHRHHRRRAHRHGRLRRQRLAHLAQRTCPNGQLAPTVGDLAPLRGAVLCLINRERARGGERPLRENGHLTAAAQAYACRMVAEGFFEDTPPNGETLSQRLAAAGYLPPPPFGYVLGENLAWGTLGAATPEAIVSAWMASPPHRANVLNPRFRETGVGICPGLPAGRGEGQPGATYAQEFGAILR